MKRRGKLLPREAKMRAVGLLDMLYMPSEFADELGIEQHAVYHKLIPAGLPHSKDDMGHVWIHGQTAAQWIRSNGKAQKTPLAENEVYCLRCRAAVPLVNPKRVKDKTRNLVLLKSTCPVCGATVNKGVKRK